MCYADEWRFHPGPEGVDHEQKIEGVVGPIGVVAEGRRVEGVAASLVGLVGGPDGVDV